MNSIQSTHVSNDRTSFISEIDLTTFKKAPMLFFEHGSYSDFLLKYIDHFSFEHVYILDQPTYFTINTKPTSEQYKEINNPSEDNLYIIYISDIQLLYNNNYVKGLIIKQLPVIIICPEFISISNYLRHYFKYIYAPPIRSFNLAKQFYDQYVTIDMTCNKFFSIIKQNEKGILLDKYNDIIYTTSNNDKYEYSLAISEIYTEGYPQTDVTYYNSLRIAPVVYIAKEYPNGIINDFPPNASSLNEMYINNHLMNDLDMITFNMHYKKIQINLVSITYLQLKLYNKLINNYSNLYRFPIPYGLLALSDLWFDLQINNINYDGQLLCKYKVHKYDPEKYDSGIRYPKFNFRWNNGNGLETIHKFQHTFVKKVNTGANIISLDYDLLPSCHMITFTPANKQTKLDIKMDDVHIGEMASKLYSTDDIKSYISDFNIDDYNTADSTPRYGYTTHNDIGFHLLTNKFLGSLCLNLNNIEIDSSEETTIHITIYYNNVLRYMKDSEPFICLAYN